MNTRGFHRGLARPLSVVLLASWATGCPKKEEPETSDVVAKAEPEPEPGAEAPAEGADDADDADEASPANIVEEQGATGEPSAADADAGDATGAAEGSATPDETEPEPDQPDPKALLKTATSPKTKDDEAKNLLVQAEEAGAKPREVAKAAVDRGLALHATPERAAAFFDWAAEKDPKYPDPVWHLAKQAAVEGDVDRAKELLGTVNERGGKKLLSQIDFDPMWEILKDDPDIRKLL